MLWFSRVTGTIVVLGLLLTQMVSGLNFSEETVSEGYRNKYETTQSIQEYILSVSTPTWKQIFPSSSPSARVGHGMVYNPNNGVTFLTGGYYAGTNSYYSDVWYYNSTINTWTPVSATGFTGYARATLGIALDVSTNKVVIFGGHNNQNPNNGGHLGDTWIYDVTSQTWSNPNPSPAPSPRGWSMMTYIPSINKIFLYGGYDSTTVFNDTWLYDVTGNLWTRVYPSGNPKPMAERGIFYNPYDDNVYAYIGGTRELWKYSVSTNTWSNITTGLEPPSRSVHSFTFDLKLRKALLFGGETGFYGNVLGDTWQYDPATNTWQQLTPITSVTARTEHMMVYDSKNDITILFGGRTGQHSNTVGDTWWFGYYPTEPWNLVATPSVGQITLTWNAPNSTGSGPITNYRIYRGTISGGETLLTTIGNVTSYVDTMVVGGTTYYYQVSAVNIIGEGPKSNEVSAISLSLPTAPRSLTATPGNTQVTLGWLPPLNDGGSAITEYRIYRGTISNGESYLTSVTGSTTTFLDSTVTNGITYYYKVSAVNSIGEGPFSNEANATPVGVPTEPQNLIATPDNGQITLTWQSPISDGGAAITGYRIYRGLSSGTETFLVQVGVTTGYVNTGLTNGVTYYYYITAINTVGESNPSNEVSATPRTHPDAPLNLTAQPGNAQITLRWTPPNFNGGFPITEYKIYRSTSSGGESYLTSVNGTTLTFTDTGLINGVRYYYYVSAVNVAGEGPHSNEADAIPGVAPTAPLNLVAIAGNTNITLQWNVPADNGGYPISAYRIYRGTISGGEVYIATISSSTTTYLDTGLTNGITYYYKVTAVNAMGESPYSNEASATPRTIPTAPRNLTALGGDNVVYLSWNVPLSNGGSTITNYKIYRSTTSGTEVFYTDVGNVTNTIDSNVINGVTYYYTVTAVNIAGESVQSNEVSVTPKKGATVPSPPRALNGVGADKKVYLDWMPPLSDGNSPITNYRIYRGLSPGTESLLTTVDTGLNYIDTNVTNGVTYYYKLTAINSVGESGYSNEISVTPQAGVTVPGAVRNLTAENGIDKIVLRWETPNYDGGSAITQYKIYRSTTPGTETYYLTLGLMTSYTDTNVTRGLRYYYKLSAVNAIGEGALSNEATGRVYTTPSQPKNLKSYAGNSRVTLNWNAPDDDGGLGITGYRIYRGTQSGLEIPLVIVGLSYGYTDTLVTNGVTYYYYVTAINELGEGQKSNEVNATPTSNVTVPGLPTNLTATGTLTKIVLTWQPPISDGGSLLLGYKIYKGTESGKEVLFTVVGLTTTFEDTNVTLGVIYYYMVSAYNSVGEGPLSNEASAKLLMETIDPPKNLTAKAGNKIVTLTWEYVQNATEYLVYRRENGIENYVFIGKTTNTTYSDWNVTNGKLYYYVVKARSRTGLESNYSNEVQATPTELKSPTNLTAIPGDGKVTLTWSAVQNATGYNIYRKKAGEQNFTKLTTVSGTNYNDIGLVNDVTYYYYVTAIQNGFESEPSDIVSATPKGGAPGIPGFELWIVIVLLLMVIYIARRRNQS